MIFHENRLQMILTKYHPLFVIHEKAEKFESVVLQILGGTLWVNNPKILTLSHLLE